MTWWKRLLVMVLAAVLLISAVWWGSGRIIPAMRRLSVSQEVRLPVLMYHGVHSNPKRQGIMSLRRRPWRRTSFIYSGRAAPPW